MKVTLARPWLIADLGAPRRPLGRTMNRPGFAGLPTPLGEAFGRAVHEAVRSGAWAGGPRWAG